MVGLGVYLVLALSSVLPTAAVAHGAGPDRGVCLAHGASVVVHPHDRGSAALEHSSITVERTAGASTYDQAACDAGELGESGQCDGQPERTALAAVPWAVAAGDDEFESDDPGVSVPPGYDVAHRGAQRARIIETCDMPRGPTPGARYFVLRTAGRSLRQAGGATYASAPASAPARPDDMPIVATTAPAPRLLVASHPLFVNAEERPRPVPGSRIERPPTV